MDDAESLFAQVEELEKELQEKQSLTVVACNPFHALRGL